MTAAATAVEVDAVAVNLVDYVLATRHDPRFTDAGIAAGLGHLLDDLAAAYAHDDGPGLAGARHRALRHLGDAHPDELAALIATELEADTLPATAHRGTP